MTRGRLAAAVGLLLLGACGPSEGTPEGFERLATLDVGLNPHQIAFSSDGSTAFVAAAGSDRIAHVDVATLSERAATAVPGTPLGVVVLPGDREIWITRFQGAAIARYDLATGVLLDTIPVDGTGASLFAPLPDDRWLVSVESTDRLWVLDAGNRAPVATYRVGRRPFPPAATSDGRLAFVPGYDDGTVTIVDLWNDTVLATVPVGTRPSGGVVLHGDVEYWVAVRGEDRIASVNAASFDAVDPLPGGIGGSPFSVVLSPNGRLAFVNNTASHDVSVVDVATREVVADLAVGEQPIVVAVHPSGASVWVASEGADELAVFRIPERWRGPEIDHDGFLENPGAPGATAWGGPTEEDLGPSVPEAEKTEVAVMGMIHARHRTSDRWGLAEVEATVRAFAPDVVCAEIPPDRWERIRTDYVGRGAFEDERIQVFPEYVDVIIPLSVELGFEIVPCAGWTRSMNDQRRARLATFDTEPEYARERTAYAAERAAARERTGGAYGGNDDPRFIHSDGYDEAARAELEVYDRFQNELIGPGGWTNINVAHWRLIRRTIERNHGHRVLVTFGGGHKYWQLDRLRERRDVRLVDLEPFLPTAR